MEQYDITVHEPGSEALSMVVIVLLVIFFPIGIIVFITRAINRLKNDHTERVRIRACVKAIKSETSISQSKEIAAYFDLYKKGIITQAEFEAKKESVLLNTKLTHKRIHGI